MNLISIPMTELPITKRSKMDNKELLSAIRKKIESDPLCVKYYEDYFQVNRSIGEVDGVKATIHENLWLRRQLTKQVQTCTNSELVLKFYDVLRKTYFYTARDIFADYMVALEWNRPARERFYQPRALQLAVIVDGIQRLVDDELDELFLSMPPRVGKTTMLLFATTWIIGRDPERSNLYSAFSDIITSAFYHGVLEIINDSTTYCWKEIFPEREVVETNAKDETINIDRKKRYFSLTCRSLYGTLNGACDASGFLISDDLVGGIEEALNKDRLVSAWSKVDNNLIPRAKESCKLLWCGTRWSIGDPAGLRIETLQTDSRFEKHRYKIINVPALNSNGESNFDYLYGVGFSTNYYEMRRASFEKNNDSASWYAQYMGEPVERSGVLFEPSEMRYFNGELPPEEHLVRKFIAVDPAFGGGDFCSAPICYMYDDGSIYVVDVVFSNASKISTQPEIVRKCMEWSLQAGMFECTKMTASYYEKVDELLREQGYRMNLSYRSAPNSMSKEMRIFDRAPEIREFYFLESAKRNKEYQSFMTNVFSFKITGGNKHDDAPDSLAMAVDFVYGGSTNAIVRKRIF